MKLPDYEKSLHNEFNSIYKELLDLKNNRSQYINSHQIYQIYNKFLNDLNELSILRKDEEIKGMKLELPNSNDSIIDDIWQLISLCFITCGLTKFAPATYSSLSTVYKLLLHLKEGKLYTDEDLKPIKKRLEDIKEIIEDYNYNKPDESRIDKDQDEIDRIEQQKYEQQDHDGDNDNDYNEDDVKNESKTANEQINYIRRKYNKCEDLFNELNDKINQIPDDVKTIYYKLLKLRRNLINLLIEDSNASTKNFEIELKLIEQQRDNDGNFKSIDEIKNSSIILNGLLDDCNNLIKDINIHKSSNLDHLIENLSINEQNEEVQNKILNLKKLYKQLCSIKLNLENLLITRRWTLRETDLYNYQNDLKSIETKLKELLNTANTSSTTPITTTPTTPSSNSNNNFKNFQILLLYLLRRCYSLIYKLLESSEPVSESLQPIHNQLQTVRRCLLDIKRIDGLNNLRELYPFQFKLASLDNLRNDGRFIINNQIPEGQGTLNALLAECFDIIHELKIELEAKEDEMDEQGVDEKILTDDEDINSDDEVELKRNRYVGFNEADYDQESESEMGESEIEYEANDYY